MEFHDELISCSIQILGNNVVQIVGSIINYNNIASVLIVAPNPIDKRASYSGTGLPFPCSEIAFEETPNKHLIDKSGQFNVKFSYPNSYYTVADKKKIVSSIFFVIEMTDGNKVFKRIELPDMCILKTLINRETRNGPEFYSKKYDVLPVDTAEVLMYQYSKFKTDYGAA